MGLKNSPSMYYNVVTMLFQWDAAKAGSNITKHVVSFALAQSVFDDQFHLSLLEGKTRHEERWVTIGVSADQKTLVVVHTYRLFEFGEEIVRIISARRATPKERQQYVKGI